MQTAHFVSQQKADPTQGFEAELTQFLPGCPLQMKLGSNICYCSCPPWVERNKRRIKRLRKMIKKFFTEEDYDIYLLHLIPWANVICTCPYGNYMVQEVMAGATTTTLQIFISSCSITDIMVNEFGSRVVENLTEMHNGLFVPLIFNRISHIFNRLARNPRANYGVQKLCGLMPLNKYGVVLRVALPYAARLSMDPHGAYVIQVILNRLHSVAEHGFVSEEPRQFGGHRHTDIDENGSSYPMFETFLNNLVEAGPRMIQHPVGNFTVQAMVSVLPLCPSAEQKFVNGICEHIVMYVACKFGTRVVESVLECGSAFAKESIMKRMMELNEAEFSFFLRTESAQYLYPKVLSCSDEKQREVLDDKTNHALAENANPYAVGLLIEDSYPSAMPQLEKKASGNSSYTSCSSSSGDETVEV